MNRGKGYLPDRDGHRKTPLSTLLARRGIAADAIVPTTFLDLLDLVPPTFDQGATGSCTGHAVSRAISIRCSAAAEPLPWLPSPGGIYTVGRCIDRARGIALEDVGAEPNQVVRGVSEWGIHAMGPRPADGRFSDCDPSTINVEPDFGDLEADASTTILGAYAITSVGAQREQEIKLALFHRFPITIAVDASDGSPIQRYVAGDSAIENMGTTLDHYVCADAYRGGEGRPLELHFGNSWGDWGEDGGCWLGRTAIQQIGDLLVFDIRKVVSP